MPKLVLKFKNRVIKEVQLEKGKSLNIGRRNTHDIVIENLAVSGNHAKIDALDDGWLLTDLQSKNGTFVNEQLITTHWLKEGDVITIGKHAIEFNYEEGEDQPEEDPGAMDKTMVMDTKKQRDLMAKMVPASIEKTVERSMPSMDSVGVLAYLSGGEGEIELNRKLMRIGKDPNSDIVVKGLTVGKTAATISKRPNGFYLSFVEGMAKPKVNGKAIKESIILNEFDVIELGAVKFQFVNK